MCETRDVEAGVYMSDEPANLSDNMKFVVCDIKFFSK